MLMLFSTPNYISNIVWQMSVSYIRNAYIIKSLITYFTWARRKNVAHSLIPKQQILDIIDSICFFNFSMFSTQLKLVKIEIGFIQLYCNGLHFILYMYVEVQSCNSPLHLHVNKWTPSTQPKANSSKN